jgi:putative Mg2+ transporter-C (MgtC) family protein
MTGETGELAQIAIQIGVTALLAGAIGAEREWTGKWAGLRTHMLIGVGATLLTHVSARGLPPGGIWDSRIASQIVTGVGFIGAGTILQSRGAVHGLTTAAGLWVSAAIGIAIGAGAYEAGVVTTVALLLILTALRPLEDRLLRSHVRTVVLQLERGQRLAELIGVLEELALETDGIEVSRSSSRPVVTIRVRGSQADARHLIEAAALQGFRGVDESDTRHRPPPLPPSQRTR